MVALVNRESGAKNKTQRCAIRVMKTMKVVMLVVVVAVAIVIVTVIVVVVVPVVVVAVVVDEFAAVVLTVVVVVVWLWLPWRLCLQRLAQTGQWGRNESPG